MLNLNNNAALIRREILVRIARLQLEGRLEEGVRSISREMAPKGSEPFRCCVYHDRAILETRVIARLGHSVEDYDGERELSDYARESLSRERPTEPMLTVLDEACNACVKTHYMVTNACQGCVARPCAMNCPRQCIEVTSHKANIDPSKCVNCGLCMQNCPYHAIVKIPVPCEEACPVGAIAKDESGKERIDYSKCILCGACMRDCPFGAMMDKGQIVDVLRRIMDGRRVVALYAPAIAAQFRADIGQLEGALAKAGFSASYEVALGADKTSALEAKEFEERMERGDILMTTSCCSAYVRAVNIHVPELIPCVSDTRSPMHYAAEIAKEKDPACVTVFVGPCLAKRKEGLDDPLVDYVISAEELGALFVAREIDVSECERAAQSAEPTASGRDYARSGGVSEAVRLRVARPESLKPFVINGLDRAGMRQLAEFGKAAAAKKECGSNLVEVMACAGGCIAGPSVITNQKVALALLKVYVGNGAKKDK